MQDEEHGWEKTCCNTHACSSLTKHFNFNGDSNMNSMMNEDDD